jgi:benzoyl-CoA reductase/2-hydroxyglutaryl-CoA dehydratase subunit BcrC/BadD/HgdB
MKKSLRYYTVYYAIYSKYWLLTWIKIIPFVLKHGIFNTLRDLRRYPWLVIMLKVNRLLGTLGKGRSKRYQLATSLIISGVVTGVTEMLGRIFFKPDRLIIHEDMVPPEIFRAMGLSTFVAELNGLLLPMIEPHSMETYIDECENEGIPPDICSLPKSTMGLFLKEETPPAKAIVTSNLPCDGGMSSYSLIEKKLNIPTFRLDIPHHFKDERALAYFAEELKRMIRWLEEHTPGRMDWDRLREICEERNRMVELELELWDLVRIRPAPIAGEVVWLTHLWFFNLFPGSKTSTQLIQKLVALGKQNLEEGVSAVKDEKYRTLLWNPPLVHFVDLFNWAEHAYGISLVMDSMTFNRLPYIDTSTPDTLLEGIGRNIMNGPMARHTRGPADNYLDDIFHIHKQFDLDMLWVGGHIGCKNTQALNGMLRERCREAGLPLLIIDYDLSDPRIVSREGILEQVNHFMENIMKAKRLDLS